MKKQLIFCIALMAVMASCMKEPEIHRRLTDEEAAAIPYQLGQTVNFVDQNGDKLAYTVVLDTICLNNDLYSYHEYWPYSAYSKMSFPDYYYNRVVQMKCERINQTIGFLILPGKELSIGFGKGILADHILLNDDTTEILTIGETTYENVHSGYNPDTYHYGSLRWYYSEEVGLISIKDEEGHAMTLIP